MIRIRLRRVGKKGQPYYRVVVAEQHAKRDGAFIESLGSYDPHASPPAAHLNEERAREWISKGAQPSESAEKILRRAGILAPVAAASAPGADAPAPAEAKPAARRAKATK
jgi:small subunit ribosomal protein S16